MATPDRIDTLVPWYTEDPFCAVEGVKTLETNVHHECLLRCEGDLRLHLAARDLPYTLTSDLLIRNVPLKAGVSPDIALWPGKDLLQADIVYGSLKLSAALRPDLILEIASESTYEADRDIKYDIYRLAEIPEYWLYDPIGCTGGPPFLGWRLADGDYVEIVGRFHTVAGHDVVLYPSTVLETAWGLADQTALRLLDPVENDWYRTTPEAWLQVKDHIVQVEEQAAQEGVRAQRAEEQTIQAEARAQRAEEQAAQEGVRAQRAEEQTIQAEARAQRAEEQAAQEGVRAQRAEEQAAQDAAEIARLKALLQQRTG